MSNLVYPALPGVAWPVSRTSMWSNTVKTTDSGRDFSVSNWVTPRYQYKLTYEFLREWGTYSEADQLVSFFNSHRGNFDTWLFTDPMDNEAVSQLFGVGDGTTAQFQLVRSKGSLVDPVYDLNGTPAIYVNGVLALGYDRKNLLLYSEQFDQSAWIKTGGTITATGLTDPLGGSTADRFQQSAGTGTHSLWQEAYTDVGQVQGASLYVKPDGASRYIGFVVEVLPNRWSGAIFDLVTLTGAAMTQSGPVSSVGVSSVGGFYRITMDTRAYPDGGTANWWHRWGVCVLPSGTWNAATSPINSSSTFAADGTSGVTVWGADLETGGVNTYIRSGATQGVKLADYLISSTGLVSFATPPAASYPVVWSGHYYWRCRFTKSMLEVSEFMQQLHEAKTVEFITCKP